MEMLGQIPTMHIAQIWDLPSRLPRLRRAENQPAHILHVGDLMMIHETRFKNLTNPAHVDASQHANDSSIVRSPIEIARKAIIQPLTERQWDLFHCRKMHVCIEHAVEGRLHVRDPILLLQGCCACEADPYAPARKWTSDRCMQTVPASVSMASASLFEPLGAVIENGYELL